MKNFYFPFFLLIFSGILHAQNEASVWYFGQNAGLQFDTSTNTVTAITNGELNTLEGCTSISDQNGDLLFYSDGRTIWNSNHQPMPNANENFNTGLLGDDSSTSSGLIVPKPQDANFYYIFTVDEPHHFNSSAFPNEVDGDGVNDGLAYSLVDMSLEGGLGDVDPLEKNITLETFDPTNPDEVDYKCSEKITAVKADDCSSFWVITHFTNKFYAFKIDENGVETTPVISEVGPEVPVSGYRRNSLGYIKASPDGTKLVVAHFGFSENTGQDAAGGVYLFDFDNDTGIVSNEQEIYGPENGDSPYGVEFSAENTKVYATIGLGPAGNGSSQVLQWDLLSDNISDSQTVIHTSNTLTAGALQLGLNQKIYRAQMDFSNFGTTGQYLGVINNPELIGNEANFVENGLLVDVNNNFQNLSRIGLPPFIQSLFNSTIDIIQNGISTTELKLCNGSDYTLTAEEIDGAFYSWSKDGAPISETTYQLFVDEPGFYEVFIEPNNGECPIEGEAIVTYHDIPILVSAPNIENCNSTFNSQFDLTINDSAILGAQDPANYSVHYYTSMEDAINNMNEIIGAFDYTGNGEFQTIYAVLQNDENEICKDFGEFQIKTYLTPNVESNDDFIICDSEMNQDTMDGIATFDLTEFNPQILGDQDENLFSITYHNSEDNAINNTNALPNIYTNVTPNQEELFVRIENNENPDCFSVDSFSLIINNSPIANDVSLIQCDEDGISEGFTIFNLNQITEDITEGEADRTVHFFLDIEDAENHENELNPDFFENFFNPQILIAKVVNDLTGCISFSTITLDISSTAISNIELTTCDDDGTEDGFQTFNLNSVLEQLENETPIDTEISFYENYEDALTEQNSIGLNYTNTTPYQQIIYARGENMNACFGISEINLVVYELPQIETEFETLYCLNFFPETITLTAGLINDLPNFYYFEWSTGETSSEIMVNEPGTYTVNVINTDGCFKTRTITVLPSNIATIEGFEISDASSNNSITVFVTGEGDYEYAIDSEFGPYQDSNVFENVLSGFHTIYVRDKNNCGVVDDLVSVIGFPKFFTPNNDTYNDTWQVKGLSSQFQPNSIIYIFDRYGKLIKELDPLGIGWDGTLNGYALPASDYWFAVTLEDGRVFRGHFALKR
ncbi:MAG: hypothetical protein BM564_05315 [Bacteroidetes bacterium MedPE-SWsnd-G2]|nr:MAG: hypothetical protein BM564_05315 [Bacteroidetes bacterium MedPE-SWsnd-G2]